MKDVLISVIVPCYNQAQYLDECLQSVLDQTYQNWECIIVNDGSPDNTEQVALQWTKKDSRFIYLKKENGGVASARNYGIENAKGDWILPLDGDDKISVDYLFLANKEFNNDFDLIYCKAKFFGEINTNWDLKEYTYSDMLISNMIFCSAFYRKESWEKSNGYDQKLIFGYEDWEFWISMLTEKSKVFKLDYFGFYYRRKKESRDVSVNADVKKKIHSFNYIYTKHLNRYLKYNENAIENYKKIMNNLDSLNKQNNILNKNIITRILFKIIKIF